MRTELSLHLSCLRAETPRLSLSGLQGLLELSETDSAARSQEGPRPEGEELQQSPMIPDLGQRFLRKSNTFQVFFDACINGILPLEFLLSCFP